MGVWSPTSGSPRRTRTSPTMWAAGSSASRCRRCWRSTSAPTHHRNCNRQRPRPDTAACKPKNGAPQPMKTRRQRTGSSKGDISGRACDSKRADHIPHVHSLTKSPNYALRRSPACSKSRLSAKIAKMRSWAGSQRGHGTQQRTASRPHCSADHVATHVRPESSAGWRRGWPGPQQHRKQERRACCVSKMWAKFPAKTSMTQSARVTPPAREPVLNNGVR